MFRVWTISIALGISVQIAPLALSAIPGVRAEAARKCYTVQVLAAPIENKQAMLSVYESLRDKGRLVYYYPKRVGERQYLRLRAGIFESQDRAREHAEALKNEGFAPFVAEAEVAVTRFKNEFNIVTTPSGIWLVTNSSARELYAPAQGLIDRRHTTPQIAPDGAAIAFYAAGQIVKVTLHTGDPQVLVETAPEENLFNSIVQWSPDGRYLAYLDAVEWELPTRLWVMRPDGTERRCLIGDATTQTKVKSFQWHPNKDRIFCAVGPTYGTVSLGGSLCCITLDGVHRTLVEASADSGIEVLPDFRIADGLLHYRTVQHDPDGSEFQYASHQRAIGDLD